MTMGRTGIEPVALSLKVRCSTPELTTLIREHYSAMMFV